MDSTTLPRTTREHVPLRLARLMTVIPGWLPRGLSLRGDTWSARHRGIVALLWVHVAGLLVFGVAMGESPPHVTVEVAFVATMAALASLSNVGWRARSAFATTGLLSASAILVHLSGGYVEAHFHFFVVIAVIALYHDWIVFLLAIVYVALHHGVVGVVYPEAAYNHPSAQERPWLWAGIHAVFVLGASAASVVHWRLNEQMHRRMLQAEADQMAAEAAAKERDEFLTTAAHELKTPLTTIKATAQLLSRRMPERTVEQEKLHSQLQGQIHRMEALVADLLDASRIQHGHLAVHREPVDLVAVVAEVIEPFRTQAHGQDQHVFVVNAPRELVGSWDRVRVTQIVTNLVSNAVKYSSAGSTIHIDVHQEGDAAVLSVTDQGVGIPVDEQPLLFQPFARSRHTFHSIEGTGLGLYITRQLVELLGGTITFKSALGRGSTFTVTIPRA